MGLKLLVPRALLVAAVMVTLAVAAFVPPFLHRDRPAAVSEIAYMRLRAEAATAFVRSSREL